MNTPLNNPNDLSTEPTSETEDMSRSLSVVVPFYNEEDNIDLFFEAVHEALKDYDAPWELIAVNDGSSDATRHKLDAAKERYGSHITNIHFARNFGQTAAMQSGIDASRGALVATLDGDLQNDPGDIPMLIDALFERDLDMISGWRK
ncbi:MAG: glycosyltransferase, partial [Pontibacterium sp.]